MPFYIPWRSLTHWQSPNLVVAGKAIATTFYANAAVRVHPAEWSTGVAAGAAAALMVANDWTTGDVAANVKALQALLQAPPLKSPLVWTIVPSSLPPPWAL